MASDLVGVLIRKSLLLFVVGTIGIAAASRIADIDNPPRGLKGVEFLLLAGVGFACLIASVLLAARARRSYRKE